ncbi:MAG: universal stress protein [Steroidobacteraceae bacterium]
MDQISDILVIVDPLVRDQPAVEKAAALARWLGAGIELLICDTKRSRKAHLEGELPPPGNAPLNDNLAALLERLAEPLRDDGLDVTTHLISGDPLHQAITTWMRNSPADLVVKDTHHHSFAERAFGINTDWHLIRTCPVPLLLTKPKSWSSPPVLMAAVDPVHDVPVALDQRILNVAASIAKRLNAKLHAIHAYLPATVAMAAVGGMTSMMDPSAKALAGEQELRYSQIKQLTDQYGIVDGNLHVDAGMAAEYIPRMAAGWHADIVVMGAIVRSGLKCALIGNTAEHVLETLPCDVLVVKPTDFAQNLPF